MHEIFGPGTLISEAHPENEHRLGQIRMAAPERVLRSLSRLRARVYPLSRGSHVSRSEQVGCPGVRELASTKGGVKMAQRNPVVHDDVSTAEIARRQMEKLAVEQGVQAITDFDSLKADFWPEHESVDD